MSKTDSIKFCQYTIFRPISIRLAADMSQWLRSVKTQSEARWWLNKSANWWEFLIINGPFHVADVKNMAKHVNLAGKSHQMVIKWRISWRFSWENHRYVRDFLGMWKIAGGYLKWFLMFFGHPFKHLSIDFLGNGNEGSFKMCLFSVHPQNCFHDVILRHLMDPNSQFP
jgi:hypothetical protein